MAVKEATADVVSTNILDTLQNIRKGALIFDMAQKMEELVKAIKETGKPGEFRVTLKLDPEEGDAAAITVADSVKIKKPEAKLPKTYFFATDAGTLTRDDPRQGKLKGFEED